MILPKCYYHGGYLHGPPVLASLYFRQNKNGGLDFVKAAVEHMGVSIELLYDGFFLLPSSGR